MAKVNDILEIWIIPVLDNRRFHKVVELLVEPVFVHECQDGTDQFSEKDHPQNRGKLHKMFIG